MDQETFWGEKVKIDNKKKLGNKYKMFFIQSFFTFCHVANVDVFVRHRVNLCRRGKSINSFLIFFP